MTEPQFQSVIQKIDQANSQDPHVETWQGKEYPKELLYSMRMTEWLDKFKPDASEVLKIAARAQHICRWEIPREDYSMDRVGYLKWRTALYGLHADKTSAIMRECGCEEEVIERVASLLRKKNIKSDPDMQILEDVIALVFLENYFSAFSQKHDDDKIVDILRKTWKKMSAEGREAALEIPMKDHSKALVEKALREG